MDIAHIGFLFLVFVVITYSTFIIISRSWVEKSINHRLQAIREKMGNEYHPFRSRFELAAQRFLAELIKFSKPSEDWETSTIRTRMINSGYKTELDALFFYGYKTLCTFTFPLICLTILAILDGPLLSVKGLFFLIASAASGYYLPDLWLYQKSRIRQREITESFPNALDLMRVCVNAGLGLDAAIERVGRELKIESKSLADEFHTLNLELRTGSTRERALRNLAERTGVEDVNSLVSMLIQTEHFGTSVGDALRVHAEGLRLKRNMRAQEAAAKVPVKLTVPMILCIFPALMVVVLGPAIISIGHTVLPVMNQVTK